VKNEASKEFTSVESDIDIQGSESLSMGDLVLAYKKDQDTSGKLKAFKIGDIQLFPSPRNEFCTQDDLIVFFQAFGLGEDLKRSGSVRYLISSDEGELKSLKVKIPDFQNEDFYVQEFSVKDFPSGFYEIRVSLFDGNGNEILHNDSRFSVAQVPAIPRAWISSIVQASSGSPVYFSPLADQFLRKGEAAKAKALAEKAYRLNPTSLSAALSYGNILFNIREYRDIVEVLTPFYLNEKYEVLELLARSTHALGELDQAIHYYREYLSHFGLAVHILSFLGECYYRAGNEPEALSAWEKSLELNPNQEEIKKMVETLKRKN
jgi:tetratricopeptide (TPR) repeat protein